MSFPKKKIVVLSGAGISAESGLGTFRDTDGLWENYNIHEVATIDAWHKNPSLVLKFYDERRANVMEASPNLGHAALVQLEKYFEVTIITQNIDDLHERAGSSNIIHLHGEILKCKSEADERILYNAPKEIKLNDLAPDGKQMRPHVVWFGEAVPNLEIAEQIIRNCDILIVVGTSLNVYPAAALRHACPTNCEKYLVDPNQFDMGDQQFIHFQGTASEQLPYLVHTLIKENESTKNS